MNAKLISLLLFIALWRPLDAKTIQVCSSCSISTIQEAVSISSPGDIIQVSEGTYRCENVEVKHPLKFIGEAGATLDGGDVGYILRILSDSVEVRGFKFINAGKSYTKDFAAIYVSKSDGFVIAQNEVDGPFFGLLIEKSKNGIIRDNLVYGRSEREDDSGNGIHLWHCANMTILKNEISGLRDGIYLEFVDESLVEGNYTHDNIRYGLHFMFSNQDDYINNTFEDNGAGVAVMFSKFIVMRRNKFVKNWGTASYGLLLKEIYDAEVVGNEFIENTIGIFNEGSTRVNYNGNLFEQNGWAVKISGGCYQNKFFKNNFISNSFDVSYNTKMNDNSFDGNYWSDYTGYDLDKDGIGDVPYRPVKLFSYIVNRTPETIILLRSLFVDIINFSEKVSPVFTPDELIDHSPNIKAFDD